MLTWAGVVLALTVGGGFASNARTDQPLMARLSKAARRGDVDRVLAGAVGLAREELETLAREATCGGQPAILRALLERGARPELGSDPST
jgi:hypothetical protein